MPRRLGPKRGINRGEMPVDAGHRRAPQGAARVRLGLELVLVLVLVRGSCHPFFCCHSTWVTPWVILCERPASMVASASRVVSSCLCLGCPFFGHLTEFGKLSLEDGGLHGQAQFRCQTTARHPTTEFLFKKYTMFTLSF